jgi:alkylated DNA repair dioxygenase AlkB
MTGSTNSVHSLPAALNTVARDGFAHLPSVVGARESQLLRTYLAGWPLGDAPLQVGSVTQRARMAVVSAESWDRQSALWELAARLRGAFAASKWRPNEATVMSYEGRDSGISPHRDHSRYGLLIAILSLTGRGRLAIVADRAGNTTLAELECRPGDLVLLRGAGLADPIDGSDPRPLHAVSAPAGDARVSLTLRMDALA